MTNRERQRAILHYQPCDCIPVVHFGYWGETLHKWANEGHISHELARSWGDGNDADKAISTKLGFDFGYYTVFGIHSDISPGIESRVVEEMPDGSRKVLNSHGVIILQKDGAGSIPAEVDHLFKGRKEWEETFKPRLRFSPARATLSPEQIAYVNDEHRAESIGIHCGSLFGMIRNWIGVQGAAYMYADDDELFREVIDFVGDLSYECVRHILSQADGFDFGHFWEDICFKNGPLISPKVFREYVGPHYARITQLLNEHDIDIVSLDCDGMIDALLPTWIENGVNTMFPIEVGTWNASIQPWREQYGRQIRGVGGMNKVVFAFDRAAIDAEIERMKPLVELGGFIPCPDHRIAPDAKWENVQYYCDKFRTVFGG